MGKLAATRDPVLEDPPAFDDPPPAPARRGPMYFAIHLAQEHPGRWVRVGRLYRDDHYKYALLREYDGALEVATRTAGTDGFAFWIRWAAK